MYFSQPRNKHGQFKKLVHELKKIVTDHESCQVGVQCPNPEDHHKLQFVNPILNNLKVGKTLSIEEMASISTDYEEAINWFLALPPIEREVTFTHYDRAASKKQFHRKKAKMSKNSVHT